MLSPPPLISMLVYIRCLTLIRLSIRFLCCCCFFFESMRSFLFIVYHSLLTVTCTRRWMENGDACKCLIHFISVLFCYKLLSVRRAHSRMLDWMRHRKRYQRVRLPYAQFERNALQLSPFVPVALFVIINAGSWDSSFWTLTFIQIALACILWTFHGRIVSIEFWSLARMWKWHLTKLVRINIVMMRCLSSAGIWSHLFRGTENHSVKKGKWVWMVDFFWPMTTRRCIVAYKCRHQFSPSFSVCSTLSQHHRIVWFSIESVICQWNVDRNSSIIARYYYFPGECCSNI